VVGLPFLSATYVGIPRKQHPWRGRDGVLQALKMLTELVEFSSFQPDEFIVDSYSVVVLGHERCGRQQHGAALWRGR
jgi:hypothetical protein